MLALMLVLFAAFCTCVLVQLYMVRQVRRVLANNHPEAWRELSSRAMFIDNAVFSFVRKKRYRALDDPELTQIAKRMGTLQVITILVWLAYAAAIIRGFG